MQIYEDDLRRWEEQKCLFLAKQADDNQAIDRLKK